MSTKKRATVVINGKEFTLTGKIGKGGSSEVYSVIDRKYKVFALKKIRFEDGREETIRELKREVENEERVIHLWDWELNEQDQSLNLLMEIGESDLRRFFSSRLRSGTARFDPIFTRYYWKEMLLCVLPVHEQVIIHSALKPDNFLLVRGCLKLIDFGISKTVDKDNTDNVDCKTAVGPVNYMAPELLQNTDQVQRGAMGSDGMARSRLENSQSADIWSLGCILYQMAYGKPPFAHIPNVSQRIGAIIDPAFKIEYPVTGIGGAPIPSRFGHTLQSCLNRDFTQRPTIRQLLDVRNPFLSLDPENYGTVDKDKRTDQLLPQLLEWVRVWTAKWY